MSYIYWQQRLSNKNRHMRLRRQHVTPEELNAIHAAVPKELWDYADVFSEAESTCMPVRKPWDHGINLKPDFMPKKGRVIPMSDEEIKESHQFIADQSAKGYIRPLKSPQTDLQ